MRSRAELKGRAVLERGRKSYTWDWHSIIVRVTHDDVDADRVSSSCHGCIANLCLCRSSSLTTLQALRCIFPQLADVE